MKGILEFLTKNNRWAIALIILLLLIGGGILKFQNNKINDFKNKYQSEVKLKNALIDTVDYYQNIYGEVVAEKLALQTSIKELEKMNDKLTVSQKELLARVKEVNKKNSVITAALIEAEARIDSLLGGGIVVVSPEDSTINFSDSTKFLMYDITIGNAFAATPKIEPTILFNQWIMPNKQFIEFHWKDDKKDGYPIEFSVSNSNLYYKTYDINSYAIPEIKPDILDPTGWEKVGLWFKRNGKVVGYVAGGVVAGATGTYMIMK